MQLQVSYKNTTFAASPRFPWFNHPKGVDLSIICCHAETCGASRHAAAAAAASDVHGFSRTFGPTGVLTLEGTEGNDWYPP